MAILLSRIIRARLSELGISVEDLVGRSELARSTVYSFLNDTRHPQGATLRKLATGLGWTAAELQARLDGTPLVSPVAHERIARIVELLPAIPEDRLDAIEQHVALAVQPMRPRAKSRTDQTAKRLEQRRRELLTGAETTEEKRPRRRQLWIRKVSTVPEGLLGSLLAAFRVNRDSGQFAPAA